MRKSFASTTRGLRFDYARFSEWLRSRWPTATAKSAAHDIGANPRTIENWLSGVSTPSAPWILRLIALYGPDFLAAVMTDPPAWLDEAQIAQERASLQRDMIRLAAKQRELEARGGACVNC